MEPVPMDILQLALRGILDDTDEDRIGNSNNTSSLQSATRPVPTSRTFSTNIETLGQNSMILNSANVAVSNSVSNSKSRQPKLVSILKPQWRRQPINTNKQSSSSVPQSVSSYTNGTATHWDNGNATHIIQRGQTLHVLEYPKHLDSKTESRMYGRRPAKRGRPKKNTYKLLVPPGPPTIADEQQETLKEITNLDSDLPSFHDDLTLDDFMKYILE